MADATEKLKKELKKDLRATNKKLAEVTKVLVQLKKDFNILDQFTNGMFKAHDKRVTENEEEIANILSKMK